MRVENPTYEQLYETLSHYAHEETKLKVFKFVCLLNEFEKLGYNIIEDKSDSARDDYMVTYRYYFASTRGVFALFFSPRSYGTSNLAIWAGPRHPTSPRHEINVINDLYGIERMVAGMIQFLHRSQYMPV